MSENPCLNNGHFWQKVVPWTTFRKNHVKTPLDQQGWDVKNPFFRSKNTTFLVKKTTDFWHFRSKSPHFQSMSGPEIPFFDQFWGHFPDLGTDPPPSLTFGIRRYPCITVRLTPRFWVQIHGLGLAGDPKLVGFDGGLDRKTPFFWVQKTVIFRPNPHLYQPFFGRIYVQNHPFGGFTLGGPVRS